MKINEIAVPRFSFTSSHHFHFVFALYIVEEVRRQTFLGSSVMVGVKLVILSAIVKVIKLKIGASFKSGNGTVGEERKGKGGS